MKRWVRVASVVAGGLVAVAGALAAWLAVAGLPVFPVPYVELRVEATPERLARGHAVGSLLCAGCHLDPRTGRLSGHHMADVPPVFGTIYSANITRHPVQGVASWSDGEIAYLLRTGVRRDGRYVPPYMVKLPNASDEDLASLLVWLRSDDPMVAPDPTPSQPSQPSLFTKALSRFAFGPLPWPERPIPPPDTADRVAHGRYLADALLGCFSCHSADFATNDELHPERSKGYYGGGNAMPTPDGRIAVTANLTPDEETGIGSWTEEQFVRAIRHGVRPDGTVLIAPMEPYGPLSDEEAGAIYAYLRTVPKIRALRPRPPAPAVAVDAGQGERAYQTYGCVTCHAATGVGLYDLRGAAARYATDEEIAAFIRDPSRTRPGIRMPTWDGVIEEQDYLPLAAYVRRLGSEPYREAAPP